MKRKKWNACGTGLKIYEEFPEEFPQILAVAVSGWQNHSSCSLF